mmetsp:Transcript_22288/g.39198  ORF Transcript_22288/g.39198 Transcript_22288/m.39198 type:complete len:265 (-) Transcript_22288:973-1767(-)
MDQTIIGSTVAGLGSTVLGHPLDTIKTHLQTNPSFHGPLHVVQTVKLGVFRGMIPPLINAVVTNTVMFSVFDQVQCNVNNPFAAGILSGFATAMISTPTDYVKIQAQLSSPSHGVPKPSSMCSLMNFSLRRLYRGHTANLAREGIFTMVYLGIYHWVLPSSYGSEGTEGEQRRVSRNLLSVAVISSITGAFAWVVSYPFDSVKTMIQSGRSWQQVNAALQKYGWGLLYKGCATSTGRAMLVTSSRMVVYEWTLNVMMKQSSDSL